MARYCKVAAVCAVFLLIVCLPALAAPIKSFSNVQLKGVSGSSAFGVSSGELSRASFSFAGNSMLERVSERGSGYSIPAGSFSDDSYVGFSNEDGRHGCRHRKDCHTVPEGGAELTYVVLSGIALFAGILISGKQRVMRADHSN
jgi:hypothetical protein